MFKKLHFKIEFLVSYIRQKYIYFSIGIIIGSLIFAFKENLISLVNQPRFYTQVIGVEGLYTERNLPESISNLISFGLTVNSENDKPILSPLVKSLDIQNNNKDYVFTLNDNIFWQNGKKFTASDVNYNINGINFIPLSQNQVKISLKNQFSPLLSALSKPLFKKNLIGLNTQYKVSQITYQEGYYKTIRLQSQKNNQKNILFRFYQNEDDLITAYKLGEVDQIQISFLPDEISNWNKTKITQKIQTNEKYSAVFLNTEKISNKQTRQALAYATPKSTDKNERCLSPISPTSWAYNPAVKEYNYDPAHAKELFSSNKISKINLSVNDRRLLPIAENIKNAWSQILGIETIIAIEDQIDSQNFEAVLAFGAIPHDPDQYLFWHSTQTQTNLTRLNNSRIDKLLEDGRQASDVQERKKIYQDFQRFLLEEEPVIFLFYPTTYTITRIK